MNDFKTHADNGSIPMIIICISLQQLTSIVNPQWQHLYPVTTALMHSRTYCPTRASHSSNFLKLFMLITPSLSFYYAFLNSLFYFQYKSLAFKFFSPEPLFCLQTASKINQTKISHLFSHILAVRYMYLHLVAVLQVITNSVLKNKKL